MKVKVCLRVRTYTKTKDVICTGNVCQAREGLGSPSVTGKV